MSNSNNSISSNNQNNKNVNPETVYTILNSYIENASLPFFADPLSRKMFIYWMNRY